MSHELFSTQSRGWIAWTLAEAYDDLEVGSHIYDVQEQPRRALVIVQIETRQLQPCD